jgi:Zn-finger nucleic acid-binding protein
VEPGVKDCPVCRSPLREIPRYGVLVDVCPGCRGIWLDRGELEKIVSLAREFHDDYEDLRDRYEREEFKRHRDDDEHYFRHKKKKHKLFSIFEDIFD